MQNPFRRLPTAALIYGMGDALTKAANFFLLPVITRFLTPKEYGILGAVMAFSIVLNLFLQLNLGGSVMRFYSFCPDDKSRRKLIGTLMLLMLGWSLLVVVLLNIVGATALNGIFRDIRFNPYLRLGTWLAFFTVIPVLPLVMLQMQQRPALYRAFTFLNFLLVTGGTLLFVVGFRLEALGYLIGQTVGAALMAVLFLLFAYRFISLSFAWPTVKMCLLFSLPLALYSLGGWAMNMSNRFFIERYVSLGELGLFNLGYQFAMILGLVLGAIGLAFTPIFYETVKRAEGPHLLARFGVFYIAGTLGLGLIISVFSKVAIQIMTQPAYHLAYRVVPILTATQCLKCIWHLIVNPLFLKKKTSYLAGLMTVAAGLSISLNFWLVPRYGITGAALAPFLANLFLTAAVFAISIRLYPVPYPYKHISLTFLSALLVYFASGLVGSQNELLSISLKAIILGLYPALLLALGIVEIADLRRGFAWVYKRIKHRV